MAEVVADGSVVSPGDAVLGDGAFSLVLGLGDGMVELDGGFARGCRPVLKPGGDDAALVLAADVALDAGLVGGVELALLAQRVAADGGAGLASAGAGLRRLLRAGRGQVLHGVLKLRLGHAHALELLLHLRDLRELLLGLPGVLRE